MKLIIFSNTGVTRILQSMKVKSIKKYKKVWKSMKRYKKVKFTTINCRGRTNVKYFMQKQLLRFCNDTAKVSSLPLWKITTKSTHFLLAMKKIPLMWTELQTKKKYKRSQNLRSKHRAVKNLQIAKTFSKNLNKE